MYFYLNKIAMNMVRYFVYTFYTHTCKFTSKLFHNYIKRVYSKKKNRIINCEPSSFHMASEFLHTQK